MGEGTTREEEDIIREEGGITQEEEDITTTNQVLNINVNEFAFMRNNLYAPKYKNVSGYKDMKTLSNIIPINRPEPTFVFRRLLPQQLWPEEKVSAGQLHWHRREGQVQWWRLQQWKVPQRRI